jgi:hypothetical protein
MTPSDSVTGLADVPEDGAGTGAAIEIGVSAGAGD